MEGEIDERERHRLAQKEKNRLHTAVRQAQQHFWECKKALENEKNKARNDIIRDATLVLATLSTSASPSLSDAVCSTSKGFGTVVIDEAGQAVEPSTIIPLV
jgi:superfamily I DNA and/or RNA helicase